MIRIDLREIELMAKVAIVIPNYNGKAYIRACLDSMRVQTFSDMRVMVIDNASEDGSDAIVENEYPNVELVRLSRNFGFAYAVNEGIKRCGDCEYVILLNNDTEADKDFVLKLYEAIRGHKRTFSVASRMVSMKNRDRLDGAGDLYCALGWAFALGKDAPVSMYKKRSRIFSSCAGAAIYNRVLLEKTGYFDERHESYLEDVDIGYRARIMGYINEYTPDAVVYHMGSGVSGSRHNAYKVRLTVGNNIYLIYKNMPILQLILNLPFIIAGILIKLVYFAKKGLLGPYMAGLKRGFGLIGQGGRFKHSLKYLPSYIKIQLELWLNMVRRIVG